VPAALQSGDHARIARWRRWKALQLTRQRRPDLYARLQLGKADQKLLAKREEDL
jgi:tRNA (guanine37-N1)-methyltransferase